MKQIVRSRSLVLAVCLATGVTGLGVGAVAPAAEAAAAAQAAPLGNRIGATRVPFVVSDQMSASVDVGTGNLMVTTSDRSAPTVGSVQTLGLMYQSLSQGSASMVKAGAAGSGWFMPYGDDTKLVAASDGTVLFLAPDGRQGVFTPVSGSSSYTRPAGFKMALVKNAAGWAMTDLQSRSVMQFTTAGRLSTVTDRNSQVTRFSYSADHVSSIQLPNGQQFSASFTSGKIASLTRPANSGLAAGAARYGYDASGRLASITRPALPGGAESVAKFTYSAAGDLASITDALGAVTSFIYDSARRVVSVTQSGATTRFHYASATQTQVADPNTDPATPVPSGPRTTYTLDVNDRVISTSDPLGRLRARTYTANGDVASAGNGTGGTATATYGANSGDSMTGSTSATGAKQSWGYGTANSAYNAVSSSDSQGNASVMSYDGVGNSASSANAAGAKSSITRHATGLVATSTDPAGRVTAYTQDATAKYISKITPPSGSGMGPTTITGNPATTIVNGAGQSTTYTYNDRYGLTQLSTAAGNVAYTYDANGRTKTRTDKNQTVTYSYDARGNETAISAAPVAGGVAPPASTISYTYDAANNMRSRTVQGTTTRYAYDAANQLVTMTGSDGSATRFAYDGAGRRTDTWWRTNATNTQWIAHTRNVFGTGGNIRQAWTAVNSSDSNRLYDYGYCYAKNGAGSACPWNSPSSANTRLIQSIDDNTDTGTTFVPLAYDKSNRLISATQWGGKTYDYTYDNRGNRTTSKVNGATQQSLSFNIDNQLSSTGFAYDKAGRRTSDPKAGTTTWNALNQATRQVQGAEVGDLSYAGLGQDELIRQTKGSEARTYIYGRTNKAGVPSQEYATKTGVPSSITNNDQHGQPVFFQDEETQQFVMYDGLGRIAGTVNNLGQHTSKYSYDPYTDLIGLTFPASASARTSDTAAASSASAGSPWTTIGLRHAVVDNWWKRGTRWNDTSTATWTSVDPITRLNNPDRANPYQYVGGDPINLMDPAGRLEWNDVGDAALQAGAGLAGGIIGGGIGFVISPFAAGVGVAAGAGCASGAIGAALDGGDGGDVAEGCAFGVVESVVG